MILRKEERTVEGGGDKNVKKRVVYLDLLRIVSVFAMMMLHVCAMNWYMAPVDGFEWKVINSYDSLARFCVNVFIMISGVFFLDNARPLSMKKLFRHNLLRLATAFVFWSFAYAAFDLFRAVALKHVPIDEALIKTFLSDFVSGHYHMWFLFLIAGLYLATPLFRKISADKKMTEYFLILAFVFCSLSSMIALIPGLEWVSSTILSKIAPAMVMKFGGYFLLGYYLYNYDLSERMKTAIYALAVAGIVVTVVGSTMWSTISGSPSQVLWGDTLPNIVFMCCGIFLFFKDFVSKIKFGEKMASKVAKSSSLVFGMYLVHDFFNIVLAHVGVTSMSFNPILSVPVLTLVVFLASLVVSYVVSKIPVVGKYIG